MVNLVRGEIHSLAMPPVGTTLLSASHDTTYGLWNTNSSKNVHTIPYSQNQAGIGYDVDFVDNRRALLVGHEGVGILNLGSHEVDHELTFSTKGRHVGALSPNGDTLLIGNQFGRLWIWDVRASRESWVF